MHSNQVAMHVPYYVQVLLRTYGSNNGYNNYSYLVRYTVLYCEVLYSTSTVQVCTIPGTVQ